METQTYRYVHGQATSAGLPLSTCWYCDQHIPAEQRFCDKNCAEAFDDDELAAERRMLSKLQEANPAFA